ncbi:hypothetical protein FCU94_01085 [Vibrio sp. JPW-9-11-11]|uniref:hypothetical protein n=1 Tax=Vibrio sp. JPW-9-11-11 TaxID=1416532 RepID=UPI001594677F|nr:hypothetical protein [Vibrio sp. JPW-9-11-11]NVD05509.1 hypothetical protein [Vibrio sp. JPW-9-11-11]
MRTWLILSLFSRPLLQLGFGRFSGILAERGMKKNAGFIHCLFKAENATRISLQNTLTRRD